MAERQTDRRWTTRIPMELPVDVEPEGPGGAPESALQGCRTRDLSLGGAFLALPAGGASLRPQQGVDLVFHLPPAGRAGPSRHRVRARVVRVTPEGLGTAFTDFDTATFRALQEILLRAPPPRQTGT